MEPTATTQQKKGNLTDANRNKSGGKKGRRVLSPLHKMMRDIFDNKPIKPSKEDSEGVRALRKLLKDKPGEFISKLGQLESNLKSQPVPTEAGPSETPNSSPEPVVDEGEERCVELLTRLLKERAWEKT